MSAVHEVAEKVEHIAHEEHEAHGDGGGGHGDGHGKGKTSARYIGLTMAVLGVLLALCSALVGSQRTELVQTMVKQQNAYAEYQASSTKYRVLMTQVEQTYAVTPGRKLTAELDGQLQQITLPPEQTALGTMQRSVFTDLSTLLTPRKSEVERFLGAVQRFSDERKAAKAWAESYDDEVETHSVSSEDFETAQVIAEVGIVIASIALLLSSRMLWIISLFGLVGTVGMAGKTFVGTRSSLHAAEEKIERAKEHYTAMREIKDAQGRRVVDAEDEETLSLIRERFGIPDPKPAAAAAAAEPAAHE